jgi:hypothetical protein
MIYVPPGDVMDDPIDDLTLEWLDANDELGLVIPRDDHALANVRDGYDSDDEAEQVPATSR